MSEREENRVPGSGMTNREAERDLCWVRVHEWSAAYGPCGGEVEVVDDLFYSDEHPEATTDIYACAAHRELYSRVRPYSRHET